MATSKLTLQINSLEALERLIGGDTGMELDIRQSVVEAFTKKHLKSIANEETFKKVQVAVSRELEAELVYEIKDASTRWSNTSLKLTDKAKSLLGEHAKQAVDTLLDQLIRDYLEKEKIRERINELVEKQAKWIVESLSSSNLEQRLNIMVDQKLKQKLGLK